VSRPLFAKRFSLLQCSPGQGGTTWGGVRNVRRLHGRLGKSGPCQSTVAQPNGGRLRSDGQVPSAVRLRSADPLPGVLLSANHPGNALQHQFHNRKRYRKGRRADPHHRRTPSPLTRNSKGREGYLKSTSDYYALYVPLRSAAADPDKSESRRRMPPNGRPLRILRARG
jgi:hypothetical protein